MFGCVLFMACAKLQMAFFDSAIVFFWTIFHKGQICELHNYYISRGQILS